jgi:hypothetical protein
MSSRRNWPLMSFGAWAATLLLLLGLGPPRTFAASCNHRVSSIGDRYLERYGLDAIITGGAPSAMSFETAQDSSTEQAPARRLPCSGPGCSSRVPMPVPAPSQFEDVADHWMLLGTSVPLALESPRCRTIDEPPNRPCTGHPSIFRPPPV